MRTALFHAPGDVRIEEVPAPRPGPGQVTVRVRAAGICGSDLHRWRGDDPWGSAGTLVPGTAPWTAGHELAGVVAELGAGVEGLAVGRPVVVEPMQLAGCGVCPACRRGDTHLCPRRGRAGGRRPSAAFAELDVADAGQVFPVPDGLALEVAALADVYACAVHALHRSPVAAADTVVIFGTGPVGMALGQGARLAGAGRTVLVGRRNAPLELARRIGAADETVDASRVDVGRAVADLTGGEGARVVFEAVGGRGGEVLSQAVAALAPGGTLVVLGAWLGAVPIPYREANRKEISVLWSNGYGSWNGRREMAIALDWLSGGGVQAAPLITHRFPLDEIDRAFRTAADKASSGAVKVMVEP